MNGRPRVHLCAAETFVSRDFIEAHILSDKGGIVQAQKVLGKERFNEMLDELQGALVA